MVLLEDFSKVNVLIVGDVMIDRFWWGSVNRISPEAPVPVVNLKATTLAPGGAANVAANISGLGANPFLVGITGDDAEAKLLPAILSTHNISNEYLVSSPSRPTTVKTRIIAHNQQIVRIDQESKGFLNIVDEENVWGKISGLLDKIGVIVISDYGKGLLTDKLIARLITYGKDNNKYVLVDPKGKDYSKYAGATILTPNRFEAAQVLGLDDSEQINVEEAGEKLISKLKLDSLLITQGEEGMTLFQKKSKSIHLPALARQVYDVTGAGDTVIGCLSVAFGKNYSFEKAANLANLAAGLVVEQLGTTAISIEMLNKSSSDFQNQQTN
jgi:D-beta-D-heptose 7-phosphate kinase / D-beta-D-heptose 1-phosphate adenosyltransferase